jgi:hypothetical protein
MAEGIHMTIGRLLVFFAVGATVGLLASRRGHARTRVERSTLGGLGGIVGAVLGAGFRAPGLPSALAGALVAISLLATLSAMNEQLMLIQARRQPLE